MPEGAPTAGPTLSGAPRAAVIGLAMPVTGRNEDQVRGDRRLVAALGTYIKRSGHDIVPVEIHAPADICRVINDCDVLVLVHSAPSSHAAGDAARTWRRLGAVVVVQIDRADVSCFYGQGIDGWTEVVTWDKDPASLPTSLEPVLARAIEHAVTTRDVGRSIAAEFMDSLRSVLESARVREDHLDSLRVLGIDPALESSIEGLSVLQINLMLSVMGHRLVVAPSESHDDSSEHGSGLKDELDPEQRRMLELFVTRSRDPEATSDRLVRLMLNEVARERRERATPSRQRFRRYLSIEDWSELWEERGR